MPHGCRRIRPNTAIIVGSVQSRAVSDWWGKLICIGWCTCVGFCCATLDVNYDATQRLSSQWG
jgi:hypothetical protein